MSLFSLIREDFSVPLKNDPAITSRCELLFNYPGVWAIFYYRIANRLYIRGWKRFARFITGVSSFLTHVDIHPGAQIGRRVFLDHALGVVIGETTIIEDDVLIYQQVTLGGVSLERTKRHPTVRSGVVIGAGAKVLGNITIGLNSKIGANSVVVSDIPDESTAIGIPARVVSKEARCKLSHNKLPDINKQITSYLLARIDNLEKALISNDTSLLLSEDENLEKKYHNFLETMKD